MKFEIDLNDILRDEYGDGESLAESIRRQVVESIKEEAQKGVKKRIDEAVNQAIQAGLQEAVKEQMPTLMNDLMNATYTPVDTFGRASPATTMREELIKAMTSNMVYKKANYDSDKNSFTRAIDATIDALTRDFRKDFIARVDSGFKQEALRVATTSILAKLGVPAST